MHGKKLASEEAAPQLDAANAKQVGGQLAIANAKIADLTQQVADLKSTLASIENGSVIPPAAFAALGFPSAGLPGAASFPEQTLETLHAQFKEETDPGKRAELAAKIFKMRDR